MDHDNTMLRVTGLWRKHSKGAGEYLAGNLNSRVRLVVFSNRYKESESSPDYYLCLAPIFEQKRDAEKDRSASPDAAFPDYVDQFAEDVVGMCDIMDYSPL